MLRGELDGHAAGPRTMARGMRAASGVVIGKAVVWRAGDADVVVRRLLSVLQNVNDAPRFVHIVS